MRRATFLIGLALFLLGALWFLQGTGIVHLRPLLCFADCAPIQRPSRTWTVLGASALLVGMVMMRRARRTMPPLP